MKNDFESYIQNMFTKLYLEKQHWNWQKNKKLLYKEKSTIAKHFKWKSKKGANVG